MKQTIIAFGILLFLACSKSDSTSLTQTTPITPSTPAVSKPVAPIIYPVKMLDSFSAVNKLTSWYITNKAFSGSIDVSRSKYWGFQVLGGGYIPFNSSSVWSPSNTYYWQGNGGHIYSDLDGDGQKDLFVPYNLAPWPQNSQCLFLYSNYEYNSNNYSIQLGLTAPRKMVLSDFDKDGKNEIMIFSHGYDANPFPGDSMAIFHVKNQNFQYLSKDIGYFHGGAVGDINNDGMPDIIGYSGGSAVIPIHPMSYINNGNFNFSLQKNIFQGFTSGPNDNFYSVELMDLNNDGKLDLILAGTGIGIVVPQVNGIYNRSNAISLPIKSSQFPNSFNFLDLNGDGNLDIIAGYTLNYNGYGIAIYINSNGQFVDKTTDYIDNADFPGQQNDWITWFYLYDKDGDGALDIVGDGVQGPSFTNSSSQPISDIWWKNVGGKFKYTIGAIR